MSKPTDEEIKKFIQNEERLWDLAAITAAATIYGSSHLPLSGIAKEAYRLADALIAERKKRLLGE